jgi:hypothetical protein
MNGTTQQERILYKRWANLPAGIERAELANRLARMHTELRAQFITETVAFLSSFFAIRTRLKDHFSHEVTP